MKIIKVILLFVVAQVVINVSGSFSAFAQDPLRYQKSIDKFKPASEVSSEKLTVFAGSSTFTNWKHIHESFPGKNVLNNGFGGSHFSDLIFFVEEAVIRYNPSTVIIYGGDNDIATGKSPEEVIADARKLITTIHAALPNAKLVLVAPKPSIARFSLKDKYIACNSQLKKLAKEYNYVRYINMWNDMLGKDGKPKDEYYLKDQLHFTKKGYEVWAKKLRKYVR